MAWTFPVVGKSEWSKGSWMPSTLTHRGRTHAAIDIYAARGQSIVSPVGGTVKAFGSSNIGGNWIQIQGSDGNTYYFAHMDKPVTLEKGQKISGGTSIGFVGNSGSARSTKTHVHFSVKNSSGKAISPVTYLTSATVVPDLEFDKTGVEGGAGTMPQATRNLDWTVPVDSASEELPEAAQDAVPAWFDQLAQYRQELMNAPKTENPTKIRAARVMHGTLTGMANMVRSSGFQTEAGGDTGIAEIDREAGER